MLAENGEVGPEEVGGGPGVEYGTYNWDPATGELSVEIANLGEGTLTDTGGDWGLSDAQGVLIAVIRWAARRSNSTKPKMGRCRKSTVSSA